jgi:hypothetical protein
VASSSALLVALVFAPPAAQAGSKLLDVSPENISAQPLELRVTNEDDGHGSVRFDIFVVGGSDSISRNREGRLEIARDEVEKPKSGENEEVPWPATWCSVRETEESGKLVYTFGVAKDMLSRATFQFRNYDPNGMPSMDVYRFLLWEWAALK